MTSKERLISEMDGKGGPTPIVLPYLGIFLRDHWREVTGVPWWATRSGDVEIGVQVAEDLQRTLGIDWVPVGLGPSRSWRESHSVVEREGRAFIRDLETGQDQELFEPPPGGEQTVPAEGPVSTMEDVDGLRDPPLAEGMIAEGRIEGAQAIARRLGADHFLLGHVGTPLWGTHSHFGFYRMMTNLVEAPDLVERLLERLTRAALEVLKTYAMAGVDGVWIEDCYTSADLISLPQFRRYAVPYVSRLIEATHALGMRSIYYFCGDVSDRLADLIAMGPTCLSLEESKKGFRIDIEEVVREAENRVCVFGNVDAIGVLQNGGEQEIRREIRRQVAGGEGGGRFVLSLGSPVTPLTPTARVRRFVEIAREVAGEFGGC